MSEETAVATEAVATTAPDSMISASAAPAETSAEAPVANDVPTETTNEAGEETLLAGKYKTAEDLESAYKELMQKYTEKRPEAPEDYNFDFSTHDVLKDKDISLADNPTYQKMVPLFKEMNLSQDQASALINAYFESEFEQVPDIGDELKALGPDANDIINRVNSFVSKELNDEDKQIATWLGQTAEGVRFMERYEKRMRAISNIPEKNAVEAPTKSSADLWEQANRYKEMYQRHNDFAAQKKYEELSTLATEAQLRENK